MLAFLIDEEIVSITTGIDGRNGAAVAHGEDAELRGPSKRHEDSLGLFVQSHRKVAVVLDGPTRRLLARKPVDDRDLAGFRQIHKDTPGRAGELKTFRMSLQWNVGDLAVRGQVDGRERAIPMANENSIGGGIDANVVGISAQIESSCGLVIRTSKQPY